MDYRKALLVSFPASAANVPEYSSMSGLQSTKKGCCPSNYTLPHSYYKCVPSTIYNQVRYLVILSQPGSKTFTLSLSAVTFLHDNQSKHSFRPHQKYFYRKDFQMSTGINWNKAVQPKGPYTPGRISRVIFADI